jgi:hypothetical protein
MYNAVKSFQVFVKFCERALKNTFTVKWLKETNPLYILKHDMDIIPHRAQKL